MNIQTLKGFRDFLPEAARKRQYVTDKLKAVFEKYGFDPLETPAVEYDEILAGKYGEEGEKLMYRFVDNGGRKVALRYDQTVPLARVVSQYQNEIALPFKRYQIQNVWRAENTQKGRYREFIQCDIDCVGTNSFISDAEIISCVLDCGEALKIKDLVLYINDRSNFTGIDENYILSIDKLDKIGREGVIKELSQKGLSIPEAEELLNTIEEKEMPENLKKIVATVALLTDSKIQIVYKPTLARGLNYYTGSIFELAKEGKSSQSLGGGGRYDELIGMFSATTIPAVGFAFGFDRLVDLLEEEGLFGKTSSPEKVLVTIFSPALLKSSFSLSNTLRGKGVKVTLYPDESVTFEKQLKYADRNMYRWVAIVGPEEADKGRVTLKDLTSRSQESLTIDELVRKLKV